MNKCKRSRLLFDGAFFGELSVREKSFLDSHLEQCPACRAELEQNNLLLQGIAGKRTGEPEPGFWDNYTANLHQRMRAEGHLETNKATGRLKHGGPRFHFMPMWARQGAAALILVVVGIFIGRYAFTPRTVPARGTGEIAPNHAMLTAGTSKEQKILLRTGKFFDRSRVILLAIDNFDPETESAGAINLAYQKKLSRDLLKQAYILKQDLSETKQRRLQELISELEVILLQIANIDEASELETLELIKDGAYIRGLLYKIRINDLRRSTYKMDRKI